HLSTISLRHSPSFPTRRSSDLIFLTSERISSSAPSLQEYKEYRESEEGGDFKTAIVHVEDLYDRFAYGVERHPMALKNFMFYLRSEEHTSELQSRFDIVCRLLL